MKNKRTHINRILTIAMLWVFSLAITPWGALHHHEEVPKTAAVEKNCTHKLHVKSQQDTCLICKAHFEKNYTAITQTYTVHLTAKQLFTSIELVKSTYTELISTSLRGPPAFS